MTSPTTGTEERVPRLHLPRFRTVLLVVLALVLLLWVTPVLVELIR